MPTIYDFFFFCFGGPVSKYIVCFAEKCWLEKNWEKCSSVVKQEMSQEGGKTEYFF